MLTSIEAFEEVQELREKLRRADALERLDAIRDERKGILTQPPPDIDPERRVEAVRNLRALRDKVRAQNQDLTQEEAEEIANRISREMIDHMAVNGKLVFERDLRNRRQAGLMVNVCKARPRVGP